MGIISDIKRKSVKESCNFSKNASFLYTYIAGILKLFFFSTSAFENIKFSKRLNW